VTSTSRHDKYPKLERHHREAGDILIALRLFKFGVNCEVHGGRGHMEPPGTTSPDASLL
jgi:hypothetical protein